MNVPKTTIIKQTNEELLKMRECIKLFGNSITELNQIRKSFVEDFDSSVSIADVRKYQTILIKNLITLQSSMVDRITKLNQLENKIDDVNYKKELKELNDLINFMVRNTKMMNQILDRSISSQPNQIRIDGDQIKHHLDLANTMLLKTSADMVHEIAKIQNEITAYLQNQISLQEDLYQCH